MHLGPDTAVLPRRAWGWLVADGVLGVIVGIAALVWPGVTVLALAILIGIGLLVQGFVAVSAAMRAMTGTPGRAWTGFFGVVAVVAGIICLIHPGAGILAIIIGMTIWFFGAGINELMAAATLSEGRGWNIALGILSIICGLIVVTEPGVAVSTAALLAGILFIVRGASVISLGLRLRRS